MGYVKHLVNPPQSAPLFGKNQVENSAGGFVFALDPFARLRRFLVLGSEGGTYYASEQKLTVDNATCITQCIDVDPERTVNLIVEVSDGGLAPKNDPAVFALALCAADPRTSAMALSALPKVCRIGTHLFQFVETASALRGWGRAMRRAVGNWYALQDPAKLVQQVTKYAQRNGWSVRDLLRLSHPKVTEEVNEIFQYVTQREKWRARETYRYILKVLEDVRTATPSKAAELIRSHGLVREQLPTEVLNSADVWEALLENMPITACIRNLGKMTSLGLLRPLSSNTQRVVELLTNQEKIEQGRVHPFNVLLAMTTYRSGRGFRGSLTWDPVQEILVALEQAYYASFHNIVPTGKRWLFGIDVSGSMSSPIANTNLSCAEATACLAMVSMRTEPRSYAFGFSSEFVDLGITAQTSLQDAQAKVRMRNFGRTDCAVPMLHADSNKLEVDAFVVLTDNETWCGAVHPCRALQDYRQRSGINAKLIVVGMTSTGFTIADPNDAGTLDIVGFDASAPAVMADFVR